MSGAPGRALRRGARVVAALALLPPAAPVARAGSILDLQERMDAVTVPVAGGTATLLDLNRDAHRWFVLRVERPGRPAETYHLENPRPDAQRIELRDTWGRGLLVTADDGACVECELWAANGDGPLARARSANRPYVGLCEDRLFLRNPSVGHRTRREWAADLLRDRVRYGDRITNFIKEKFYRERYRVQPSLKGPGRVRSDGADAGPPPVRVRAGAADVTLDARDLNLIIAREDEGGMTPGRWYPVERHPGVFAAAVTPGWIAEDVVEWQARFTNPPDAADGNAVVYLVAFDLDRFDLAFSIGTEHPRVGWSDRVPEDVRDKSLPGPDGFDTIAPLARTGKVPPIDVSRTAAAFSGGFKRDHGAFKRGDLSRRNRGSHYGFVESGVVLSRLQPGLATLLVGMDGGVAMRTWSAEDDARGVLHARQNGVPLLETDAASGRPRPGLLVQDWARGNWSGSQTGTQRTLRAGAGLAQGDAGRFLVYAYFSSTTPPAMALVFQACGCDYAMHLDMNAPEHAYLALYRVAEPHFIVERLVAEMGEVDPPVDGNELPRYLGYSDNRDFFYLTRKEEPRQ